ncbi:hypothetical protein SBF1_2950011 [Candidatus Desulfosporosinus infrequens]|uniref:Uncharacterized protein n=1 Tax=Candidatus Desulfosporosinus infrequens TaxID=2043169 RepID=A0A2U3KVX1_9FIRM|nr:hypothetical protein SBF1_2950011 [Candidatus Desulfosporosinus infrequens]
MPESKSGALPLGDTPIRETMVSILSDTINITTKRNNISLQSTHALN